MRWGSKARCHGRPVVPPGHRGERDVVALALERPRHQVVVREVALRRAARQDDAGVAAAPTGSPHLRDERRHPVPVLEALLAVDPLAEERPRLQEETPKVPGLSHSACNAASAPRLAPMTVGLPTVRYAVSTVGSTCSVSASA